MLKQITWNEYLAGCNKYNNCLHVDPESLENKHKKDNLNSSLNNYHQNDYIKQKQKKISKSCIWHDQVKMMIPKLLNNVLRRLYKSCHLIKQKSYYKGKYYLHEGNGNEDF